MEKKKIALGIVISFCYFLVVYFQITEYFIDHFYFGSEVNSISVSCKNVEDAETAMTAYLKNYTLNLKERGGRIQQIKGSDVNLRFSSYGELKKIKGNQTSYNWFWAIFNSKHSKAAVKLSYDDKLLKEKIDKLPYFDENNIIEPKNPGFQYTGTGYAIVDEITGNKIDKNILYSRVLASMLKGDTELNLEAADCYIKPKYTSKAQKIAEVKETLNKYVSSKITYTFGGSKETLDGSIINKWLSVDDNFEVIVDDKKIKDYIDLLSKTYNTAGKTRIFTTSSGNTINIGGGDYGWVINKTSEANHLFEAIKGGQTVTKKPIYTQTAFCHGSNDIGNTYIEIDIARQHIWFYKNGSLITHGNVVTGNINNNTPTAKGIYGLKYKQKNAVLRGPGYEAPVAFWMPFNGGIGIHDAGWRSAFGGNIYMSEGSHGCVNSPYNVAEAIFNNIEVNTPVVCY